MYTTLRIFLLGRRSPLPRFFTRPLILFFVLKRVTQFFCLSITGQRLRTVARLAFIFRGNKKSCQFENWLFLFFCILMSFPIKIAMGHVLQYRPLIVTKSVALWIDVLLKKVLENFRCLRSIARNGVTGCQLTLNVPNNKLVMFILFVKAFTEYGRPI